MGSKYERCAMDFAAQRIVDRLLEQRGLSVRQAAALSDGILTYSRVHDVRNGNKSPMRLSEVLAFSRIFEIPLEDFIMLIYRESETIRLTGQFGV